MRGMITPSRFNIDMIGAVMRGLPGTVGSA